MKSFRMVCLANSRKNNGRCIAGFKLDESKNAKWIRLVSSRSGGCLNESHYILDNEQNPQLFDIIEVFVDSHHPQPHHPENWLISNEKWKFIRRPTRGELNKWLKQEVQSSSSNPVLLEGTDASIPYLTLTEDSISRSLCLLKPQNIKWKFITKPFNNKRQCRAIFSIRNSCYDLGITDFIWEDITKNVPDGEYSCEEIVSCLQPNNFNPQKFLFTISLGEPFIPSGYQEQLCYKLIAAVINTACI